MARPIDHDRRRARGQVDERAADQQPDRLEPERDRPGRAADPTEQLVWRVGRPDRDVGHEHERLGDARRSGRRATMTGMIGTVAMATRPAAATRLPPMRNGATGRRVARLARDQRPDDGPDAVRRSGHAEDRGVVAEVAGDVHRERRHERRSEDRGRAPEQDRGPQDRMAGRCSRCPRGSRSRCARAAGRRARAGRAGRRAGRAEDRANETASMASVGPGPIVAARSPATAGPRM